ncbi:SIR2 family protein [Terribacillus sp. 179-K 1B1 HS]|uniref:SIR2 family protein n=1 Tax=Terribacillus sp. 179-K 1B1 HS TaxID=3142388 RepID=UPI0039A18071
MQSKIRFKNIEDKDLQDEIITYLKKKSLIPIIGAGFSRGSRSQRGIVPNGKEMIQHMKDELKDNLNADDYELIKHYSFSNLSETFFENCNDNSINKYLNNNFTNVKLPNGQKKFININWPHIYTLNIDDAIENNHKDIEVIHPFKEITKFYDKLLHNKTHLFKLHGDATEYIKHKHKCVLSTTSYLQSFQENRELLSRLVNDINSNCVIYVGCSLDDELDILYHLNVSESNYGSNLKNTYYVTSENIEDSKLKQQTLAKFGVDTVIKVEDYDEFYNIFYQLGEESSKLTDEDTTIFENPHIVQEGKGHNHREINLEYLFDSNFYYRDFEDKGIIHVPYYLIDRDSFSYKNTDSFLLKQNNLIIIQGHRFSGKTSTLLGIAQLIKNENFLFMPSGNKINNKFMAELLTRENFTLLFDTGVIDGTCWNLIRDNIALLEKQNLKIIVALDSSDDYIYQLELLLNDERFSNKIHSKFLKNTFTKREALRINKKLKECVIPEFKTHSTKKNYKKTILDNVYEILQLEHKSRNNFKKLEEIDVTEQRLIVLILLATKFRLGSSEIQKYRLDNMINEFIKDISPIAHFYRTLDIEKNTIDNSGIKLICNSRAWVLQNLKDFSMHRINLDTIAGAYKTIVELILHHYQQFPQKAREEVGKFIKFDDINDIFARKYDQGSLKLIQKIYNNLEDVLTDNYHFPHQRAKSLLWLNDLDQLKKAADYAQVALRNIEVIHRSNFETKYSYMHVWYTLASIHTKMATVQNYNNSEANHLALKTIHSALSYKKNLDDLTNDLKSNQSKNIKDFINNLAIKDIHLSISDRALLNMIVNLLNSNSHKIRIKVLK